VLCSDAKQIEMKVKLKKATSRKKAAFSFNFDEAKRASLYSIHIQKEEYEHL